MAWHRSGPERVADWLRFVIRAGFLITGIVGSILLAYLAIQTGFLVIELFERCVFRR